MSDWMKKRFWTEVTTRPEGDGFGIALDGRLVKTPLKQPLCLPTQAFADHVAAEWQAVDEFIDPTQMPFTRAGNSAIDKLTAQKPDVVAMLAEYGGSDLLCYRATHPQGLIAKQAEGWDPLLDWAGERFGGRLNVTQGVLPVAQPQAPLRAMQDRLEAMDVFQLAGAHDLITISGSLVLALAVIEESCPAAHAWELCRIDEAWQIAEWGKDDEAEAVAALKKADFERADLIFRLSRD